MKITNNITATSTYGQISLDLYQIFLHNLVIGGDEGSSQYLPV